MRIFKPNEEIPISEYITQKLCKIEAEIKNLDNEYIMNVNQEGYINMLVPKIKFHLRFIMIQDVFTSMGNRIKRAKSVITKHPYYSQYGGQKNKSSFSYMFHINGDNQSHIALELMIFHYPEEK